jgi:hypothetical protein
MRSRHFDVTNSKPRELFENAARFAATTTPALRQTQCGASVAPLLSEGRDRVHTVLGGSYDMTILSMLEFHRCQQMLIDSFF